MPRVRVHQHVNPFASHYRQAPAPVDLKAAFARPELPLHLDIGCARGRFILKMAEAEPQWNFLGVEIREPLVTEANEIAAEWGLENLHYEFCNAMIWLDRLLDDLPVGLLQVVTIQFPDPWFKKKHAKRRMVNAELIEAVVAKLAPEGRIFVQTDIEFLAEEMFALFRSCKELREVAIYESPFPLKTERERAVEIKALPIYRAMFEKSEPPLEADGSNTENYQFISTS
ncbi:MAG: tRNA (guanosine(46)-N7)-methyltransferase TrmB [Chloracidobacterium sp.]|nr:tRNA (guanosine(46)-N7)-methyltransferase TrmB [Chloracidobacterium sp.]